MQVSLGAWTVDDDEIKQALAHVLWLGGGPDAGKTTVARVLSERHSLSVYHMDQHEADLYARVDPERHPFMAAFEAMTLDERWVLRTPEEMARHTLRTAKERMGMTVEDLLALPRTPPVLAEGAWFFPEYVAPLISSARQAVWLVPTEDFKWASARRRNKPSMRFQTSDPDRTVRNWFARDMLLTTHTRHSAGALGLTVIEVDGARSAQQIADLVEGHFASFLARA